VAESIVHNVTQGLTAEQVESFKENGSLGPFDLYASNPGSGSARSTVTFSRVASSARLAATYRLKEATEPVTPRSSRSRW
jgi:hypothetical protein